MLRNYFIIAFRTLIKQPLFSFIKIAGLAVGVTGCLVIFLVTHFELSFDKWQPERDRIYRIYSEFSGVFKGFNRGVPMALPHALSEFTGLESVIQIHTWTADVQIDQPKAEPKKFDLEKNILIAGPEYFEVFSFYHWLSGSAKNLSEPFTVVLTEGKAKKYFGITEANEAMGKQITYSDSLDLTIVGIIQDIDEITDFEFSDFISISTIEKSWLKDNYNPITDWGSTTSSSQCFIKLAIGTPIEKIQEQMPLLVAKYKASQETPNDDWIVTYKVQPLSDIHYNLDIGIFDSGRNPADFKTIRTLMIGALLLLIIAAINFINLETAQAIKRSKEVGLRKTMGGTQGSLVSHFLLESGILATIAVLLAIPLTELCLIFFKEFLPEGVKLSFFDPITIAFLLLTIITVALLSGLYPAFVLSRFQPAQALKNQVARGKNAGSALLRKILTVFQFSFSQALIVGTLIVGLQIKFMLEKDMGFDTDSILTFSTPWYTKDNRGNVLHNELNQMPEIKMISRNTSAPARNGTTTSTLTLLDNETQRPLNVHQRSGDTSYFRLFKIPIIAGRVLQPSDSALEIMVNEAYCQEMGYEPVDMVGRQLKGGGKKNQTIVGVMKDFHFQSMHHNIEPLFYRYSKEAGGFSLKLNSSDNLTQTVEKIEKIWNKIYPEVAFSSTFLDERIKNFYASEKRISKLTNTATGLTIFISCLGLLGLAAFTSTQRTKEIGIRKVLGASVSNIVKLLSSEFIATVTIAMVVATPIAWYGGNYWLNNYAFKIEIGWALFVIAGGLSILISFITVAFQTIGAALSNPVESLRYE